nr:uncharacterized protein LOC109156538 [Ipomoea batatas]
MPFFNNHVDGPLIILLQLCRANVVDSEVRISSAYTATKVLFNLDCQEFTNFKNSLKANCSPLKSISVVSYGHIANNSQTPMVEGNLRYRVVVRVLDKTSDAPFLLWDKDWMCCAYDLKTKYSMSKMHVPVEFDQLRNRSMVFKLNLKHEHIRNPAKPIPVLNVMHDEELEAQYCPSMVDAHDELSKMIEE